MIYNTQYPTLEDLRRKARKRIPKFAYEYMVGGCLDEIGLADNRKDFKERKLQQIFLRNMVKPNLATELCGIKYSAPFGVAPIGLQGLIWPNAPVILAKMASKYNIPYVLSTGSTESIEQIAKVSDGQALFQLYNPLESDMRRDILNRAQDAGYRALFVTVDAASLGYRPRDIRNGLGMPPKLYMKNVISAMKCPAWAMRTLQQGGMPRFKTLSPYMDGQKMTTVADFMNSKMSGTVSIEDLKQIRDQWKGPLILKGVLNPQDVKQGIALGIDGILVSNHGARQLDGGQSAISVLPDLVKAYADKIEFSFDSGIETGTDIAIALASGAKFTFMGRPWMHGLGAMGEKGATHTVEMYQRQLSQVMTQIGCAYIKDLPKYLI